MLSTLNKKAAAANAGGLPQLATFDRRHLSR
jgi:hypothetical protein